jgi:hypothetical protein
VEGEALPVRRWVPIVEWALIVATYLVLFRARHWIGGDGNARFSALSGLMDSGSPGGIKYSLVGPIFAAPLYYVGKHWLGDAQLACAYFNWVLLGVGGLVLVRLLRGVASPAVARRFLLLLLAGSMFTYHQTAFYGEVFTALCVAAGLLSIATHRRTWLGWIAFVLGVVNTPASFIGAGFVCLVLTLETRRLRMLAPLGAVVALYVLESALHRGGPTRTGYEEEVLPAQTVMPYSGENYAHFPIALGVLALFLSFGKGLVYYAPGLFAPQREAVMGDAPIVRPARLWLVFWLGLVVVYSNWRWYGGEFWGPRYLLFTSVPACLFLARRLSTPRSAPWAALTLALLTLSIWIGAEGAIFGTDNLEKCQDDNYALEHLCWYVPEWAAWIRPFIAPRRLAPREWDGIVTFAVVYLWLAIPLARDVARSMAQLRHRVRPWFASRAWRL